MINQLMQSTGTTSKPSKQITFKNINATIRSISLQLCIYHHQRNCYCTGANNRDKKSRLLLLENNSLFIRCVSNINGVLTDNA